MITINLRDFYPWCKEDIFVEITEEMDSVRKEANTQYKNYEINSQQTWNVCKANSPKIY